MDFTERSCGCVRWLAARSFDNSGGVVHGFSTRLGGVSTGIWESMNLGTTRGDDPLRVRENYRLFCSAIGADPSSIVMSNQIHSDVIKVVGSEDVKKDLYDPEGYEVDGLITNVPGIVLTIFSADCLPMLFYDPVQKVAAASHAGWRGTALGIAARTIEKMTGIYGSRPQDILAAIGPGISKCCFETHGDVPDAMYEAFGEDVGPFIEPLVGEKYKVDLKGINALVLKRCGLVPEHIAVCADCTMCLPGKYWSHRATQGVRGSQAAMIQLKPET